MAIYWAPEQVPEHTPVIDSLGRPFRHRAGRFHDGVHALLPADLEWPLITPAPDSSRRPYRRAHESETP